MIDWILRLRRRYDDDDDDDCVKCELSVSVVIRTRENFGKKLRDFLSLIIQGFCSISSTSLVCYIVNVAKVFVLSWYLYSKNRPNLVLVGSGKKISQPDVGPWISIIERILYDMFVRRQKKERLCVHISICLQEFSSNHTFLLNSIA